MASDTQELHTTLTGFNTIVTGIGRVGKQRLSYNTAVKVDALLLLFNHVPDIPEASEARAALYSAVQAQAAEMRARLGNSKREAEQYHTKFDGAFKRFQVAFHDLARDVPGVQATPEI